MIDYTDVSDYLEYVTSYDNYFTARCPFHQDNRPSFFVYPEYYICKSCGAKGNIQNLHQKLSKTFIQPTEEPKFYNPWTGWIKKYNRIGLVLKTAYAYINKTPSTYLAERGISHDVQTALRLGYLDGWYTFPVRATNGKICGGVARKPPDSEHPSKYVIPKGQDPNMLYVPSWELVNKAREIFLVFGILDAVSLYSIGIASMSTTTGKQLRASALDSIHKRILIIPDKGEEQEGEVLAAQLSWRGKVQIVHWPEHCKDINDLLVRHKSELISGLSQYIVE